MLPKIAALMERKGMFTPYRRLGSGLQRVVWGILLLVSVSFSLAQVLAASHTPTDFCTDYVAAQRLVQGIPPYLPLHCWSAIDPFPPPLQEFDTHPPSSVLLFLPVTLLSRAHAVLLWALLSLASYMAMGWLLLRELGWGSLKGYAIFMLLSLGWAPFFVSEHFLNLTQVLTLLLVAAWVLLRQGYPRWAGGFFGIGGLLKIWPALVLATALVRRRWAMILAGVGVLLLGEGLSLLVLGPSAYSAYLGLVQHNENYVIASLQNSSLVAALARPFLSQSPGAASLIPALHQEHIVLVSEIVAGLLGIGVLAYSGGMAG